jgi:hypothetical protein
VKAASSSCHMHTHQGPITILMQIHTFEHRAFATHVWLPACLPPGGQGGDHGRAEVCGAQAQRLSVTAAAGSRSSRSRQRQQAAAAGGRSSGSRQWLSTIRAHAEMWPHVFGPHVFRVSKTGRHLRHRRPRPLHALSLWASTASVPSHHSPFGCSLHSDQLWLSLRSITTTIIAVLAGAAYALLRCW